MYSLKKLKNQVNIKKLITFLNLYKHIVFYHSRKVNTATLSHGDKLLFQIHRVRKLASQVLLTNRGFGEQESATGKASQNDCSNKGAVDQVDSAAANIPLGTANATKAKTQKILSSVIWAGNTGTIILVGCDSLENMQKCIAHSQTDENWVVLGGIYDTAYINQKSCLQLVQLNPHKENKELVLCIQKRPQLLLQQCLSPLLRLQQCLNWRSKCQDKPLP